MQIKIFFVGSIYASWTSFHLRYFFNIVSKKKQFWICLVPDFIQFTNSFKFNGNLVFQVPNSFSFPSKWKWWSWGEWPSGLPSLYEWFGSFRFKPNYVLSRTWGTNKYPKTIPASILKQTIEVHLKYLTNTINHSLKESTFPDELEQSEVTPVYKNLTLYRRRIIH